MILGQAGDLVAGRYRLDRFVGGPDDAGQWQGFDERLARTVAVRISPVSAQAPSASTRSDLTLIAQLIHPAVAAVYDAGITEQFGGGPVGYAVSEWTEGRTLGQILATGPQTWKRTADWGRQISGGLAALHGIGIVHGGLGPNCVVVHDDRRVKILDAGLAPGAFSAAASGPEADAEAQTEEAQTEEAQTADPENAPADDDSDAGTEREPVAESPTPADHEARPDTAATELLEPVAHQLPPGAADDVYALGLLLWQAVVGVPPAIPSGAAPDESPLRRTGAPPEFCALLMTLLDEDPHRRPLASVAENRFAQFAVADRVPDAPMTPPPVMHTAVLGAPAPTSIAARQNLAGPSPASPSRRGVLFGLVGLVAAAGVAVGLLIANNHAASVANNPATSPGPSAPNTGVGVVVLPTMTTAPQTAPSTAPVTSAPASSPTTTPTLSPSTSPSASTSAPSPSASPSPSGSAVSTSPSPPATPSALVLPGNGGAPPAGQKITAPSGVTP